MATTAAHYVFHEDHHMTTNTHPDQGDLDRARHLRTALADNIAGRGPVPTRAVETAFRTVPRHLFLPDTPLTDAYAPRPVVIQRAPDGTATSSASSPNLVADMLELLDVAPGHHVLEIGAATGINAALIAEITGPAGHVTTVEIDTDLADGARRALIAAGYADRVTVITGDGADGHPDRAPYDRIIVTAGAWDIAPTWTGQLTPTGRLVVPLRLHGSGLTRVLPLDHHDGRLVATTALVCGFVPMRGADVRPDTVVRLTDDAVLAVDTADHPDPGALAHVLDDPGHPSWTGIAVRHDQPAEHLDLWLATTVRDAAFGRLSVGQTARNAGTDPARRWAGADIYGGDTLAYLTTRPVDSDTEELGIVTHGHGYPTALLDDLLHHWDRTRPTQPAVTVTITSTAPGAARNRARITVTWPDE